MIISFSLHNSCSNKMCQVILTKPNPVSIGYRKRKHRFVGIFYSSAVLTGCFLKRIDNCSRSVINQNSRSFSFMGSVCYPQVHSCMQTSGVFRNLRIFVQITKNSGVFTFVMTYSAVLPCGYTSCIFCEIRWRIAVNKVQTCFSAHTARTAALRHRKSIGIITLVP